MSKRSLSEMMKAEQDNSNMSNNNKGLKILREHVAEIQAQKPAWINSVHDVIIPKFVCPPEEPMGLDDVKDLQVNDDNSAPQQARVRALVTPVHFPKSVQHHTIRMELDVDLGTYPQVWPRLWIRSASATPASLTDDGSFHPHFAEHFFEAMDSHSHRERNPVETILWFFVHRYLAFPNQWQDQDSKWPSHLTIPSQFHHHILDEWKIADELMKGSGDPDLAKSHEEFGSLEEWLDPKVTEWLKKKQQTPNKSTTDDNKPNQPSFVEEISPGIYMFPLFSQTFCQRLTTAFLKEKDYAAQHNIPVRRPNNMNQSGAILKALGMESLMDVLQDRVLEPIAQDLFPVTGAEFTQHHSFLVHYDTKAGHKDHHLDMHTDDSDVTFNCCLGLDFTGAKLQFCGIMGDPDHRHSKLEYAHKPGWVVCHLGRQRHGADDITSGTRISLINWNHNKVWRRSAESMAQEYKAESGPPDLKCLSYTHDKDWEQYKGERPVQTGRKPWCPPAHAQHMNNVPKGY